MEPLRMVLVEIGGQQEFSDKIAEAARLYKEGLFDKVYLLGGSFSQLHYASRDCKRHGVPTKDVVNDEPSLAAFIKDCERGVRLIVVITSWLRYVKTWYIFRQYPEWVWTPIEFHIAGII